jgi:N-acetyl-anhydromuramyl-L-alanine amidase AmpD
MAKTVVVPDHSPLLHQAGVRVVHRYPNGTALAEVDAVEARAEGLAERPLAAGLMLADADDAALAQARERLQPDDGEGQPASETERPVSAYVEFIGQPDPRWLGRLQELGITVLAYQPNNSYLCLGPPAAFRKAQLDIVTTEHTRAIRSVTELTPDLKQNVATLAEAGQTVVMLVAAAPGERGHVLDQLKALPDVEILSGAGNDPLDDNRFRVRARVGPEGQQQLLQMPRVLSVEPYHAPVPEDEKASLILASLYDPVGRPSGSYVRWLQDHGIDGRGSTIGIVDGGVDVSHPAFAGRARDFTGGQKDWHATMVAGHAAGNYLAEHDVDGLLYGLGTAPGAQILSQDRAQAASSLCRETVANAAPGAAVQNNSWGKDTRNPMDYGSDEALYDSLVRNADPQGPRPLPLTVCFSSGNSGASGLTRPKAAKNVIVTGNSENYRPDVGGADSDNIGEVYSGAHASSYGNCGDGRIRPHVVAPGEWTATANFDCRPGEDEYLSPLLCWGGGSSGANGKTAGACALLIQWWRRNNADTPPSPAMLRALIVNGAEPITTGGPVPNNRQGWGRLNLQNIVDPAVPHVFVDQTTMLSQANDVRQWRVRAVDPARPLKITLAWTDPPGAVGSGASSEASPVVNRLALRAEIGAQMFRGTHDRFRGGVSAADDMLAEEGGLKLLPEGSDNLQNIFLPPSAAAGSVRVSVTALNITTNCLTGRFDLPQQDFALVISNGQVEAGASPASVVVAVDRDADAPAPPAGGDGHWSAAPGNDDRQLLEADAAPAASSAGGGEAPASGDAAPTSATPPACCEHESAWWADADMPASQPESEPAAARASTEDAALAARLDAGLELLGGTGHRARPVGLAEDEAPTAKPSSFAAAPLGEAVAELRERLEREAADPNARSFAAVLLVGSGTRVTIADVLGLRALALAGTLFLVSDHAGVLAFLAQRIGALPGVRYRQADRPEDRAQLLADTLAEAGGMQPVVVAGPQTVTTGTIVSRTHRFGVVAADRMIVVRILYPAGGQPAEVRLVRGGGAEDVVWHPAASQPGPAGDTSVVAGDGAVELRQADAGRYPGTWSVEVRGYAAAVPAGLEVWALGGPAVSVSQAAVGSGPEAASEDEQWLVRVAGEPGASIREVSIPQSRLAAAAGDAAPEATHDVVVRVRRSRLDSGGRPVAEDDVRPVPVPALGQVVTLRPGAADAAVLDLPLRVVGTDPAGNDFARRLRTNLVRLRPRSQWQLEATRGAPQQLHICGQVDRAERRDGLVTALQVSHGSASRVVSVDSAELGRRLAALEDAELRRRRVVLSVEGTRLHSLFRPLVDVPLASSSGDPGIEGPLQETGFPRLEARTTDYPGAARFVAAARYRSGGPGRTIGRVVIHITDGGAGIAGPIGWFQDPVSGVSVHYIVGQDGEVVQMVSDRDIAWHAQAANYDSIGIEHCARAPNARGPGDPGLYPTAGQYAASAALIAWLCERYGIPADREHILGHAEVDPATSHRGCPNAAWNWDHYMAVVTGETTRPPQDETIMRNRQEGSLHV